MYVLCKYINKLQFAQHIHEEGAVKLPQHLGSVTCVGQGLWLCPPEPRGICSHFPPLRQILAWLWGALSRQWEAGQGHQAWGG